MRTVEEFISMAVNDVYEVTHVCSLFGQQVLNVYFYEQRAAFVPLSGNTAQSLAEEWGETIMPIIKGVMSGDVMSESVRVRNLFDATDAGEWIDGTPGTDTITTDTTASFNAWGLTLISDNAGIRPGGKRLAGVNEGSQTDGVPTPTMVGYLNDVGDALTAPITGGLIIMDDIMFPVIVKRVREGVEGAYTYRLPESSGEATVGTIIEALVKLFVTSQVSRKIGVGV